MSDEDMKITLSDYLSKKLDYNPKFLSRLFSETVGMSMEKFYITNKIKHVKELLINDNLNLREISYITRYSSPAHLSAQFKKNTGLAPSQYRQFYDKDSFSLGQAIQ
jgi:YesN/AraC family two-component response regulator